MQVAVLAGGKGTRLRQLTSTIPKPMILVNGVPFLHHQLRVITSFGIHKILLLVGYLGHKIVEYFGDGSKLGLHIDYSFENDPLGTGGALKNAEDKLSEEFMVLNGDTLLFIDYLALINCYHCSNKTGVVTVYDNGNRIAPNNIALGESNVITDYNKKDSTGMTHVDAGAMVFNKDLLYYIPEGTFCSLEEEVFPILIGKEELLAFPTHNRFYDMGNVAGLELIREILR